MENQFKKIFKAIDVKDSINANSKKVYSTIKIDNIVYYLVDKTNFDLPRIDYNLRQALKKYENNEVIVEADLNSFIELFSDLNEKQTNDLLSVLVIAFRFNQKAPFTLRHNVVDNYSLKFVANQKYEKIIKEAIVISDAQYFCRYLQDKPSNMLNPIHFVDEITKLFDDVKDKVKITVYDKAAIKAEKMNVLLAVNAGSNVEPRVLVIEYLNNPDSKEKYAYIGKGITFDAGGMSIKTDNKMRGMKMDMSGAATMMCVLYALIKNNIKTNIVAMAALTENVISPYAVRPDDIIISHAGLSVEIDNTDSEGRLILADAVSFAVTQYKVTKIVDIATLTTAIGFALGEFYSGVWATDDMDWKTIKECAFNAGEYVWRMPFHESYRGIIDSDVADIVNSNRSNNQAGSCVAAEFIKSFTHNVPFVHLDVEKTSKIKSHGQAVLLKTLYHFAQTQK